MLNFNFCLQYIRGNGENGGHNFNIAWLSFPRHSPDSRIPFSILQYFQFLFVFVATFFTSNKEKWIFMDGKSIKINKNFFSKKMRKCKMLYTRIQKDAKFPCTSTEYYGQYFKTLVVAEFMVYSKLHVFMLLFSSFKT